MSPPVVAAALIAAFAPPNDYESIAGDLHEEYVRDAHCSTTSAATRWYWSLVLLSDPVAASLLPEVRRSALQAAGVGVAILAVLTAMLLATVLDQRSAVESYLAAPVRWAALGVILRGLDRRHRLRRNSCADRSRRRRTTGDVCRLASRLRFRHSGVTRFPIISSSASCMGPFCGFGAPQPPSTYN